MNRERTWRVGEMGLALIVSLGVGSGTCGQCSNDAGAGDFSEDEPCLVDEDEDTVNRGCNSPSPAFITLTTGDFIGGVVDICGSGSNYRQSAACDVDTHCLDNNCEGDPNPGDGIAEGTCVGPHEPSWIYRDLDWYLIPQSVLLDHDADGNGVVRITSEFVNAEFDAITHLIGLSDPGGTCDYSFLDDDGCWDTVIPQASNPASKLLVIAGYPDGVAVRAAPGTCDGDAIWEGYECSTGNNDYILRIALGEAPTACQPGPPQGPCNEANPSSPGCEDPACCDLVCQELEFCCVLRWTQTCVDVAINTGCAGEPDFPGQIATGDDSTVDGYLRVKPDSYGAWATPSFGGTDGGSDLFNPPGADLDAEMLTYASAFFLFISTADQRELLANNPEWQTDYGYAKDTSLDREITSPNVATDMDDNGVDDHLVSQFRVSGTGVDLTFDLTQHVEPGQGVHGAAATLTQTYEITNNRAAQLTFSLVRYHDGDLPWSASHWFNAVGTGYHGHSADRYVFIQDVPDWGGVGALPGAAVNLSGPSATAYAGAKLGADPDPGDPDCPAYGGQLQCWDRYGLPECWRNHIAYIGHNVNGSSGMYPTGDVHAALEFEVTVPAGPSPAVTVQIMYTYGQQEPLGQENAPCPWDCIATGDDGDADGYLRVKSDPLGAFWFPDIDGPFNGDLYNPLGPLVAETAAFNSEFYLFVPGTQQRVALITCPAWMDFMGQSDGSLVRDIASPNLAGDTDGDGVDDQMVSQFTVTGTGVDLTFDLTQHVERAGPGAVSTLTQAYAVTNNLPVSIDFVLVRHYASTMTWMSDWTDDSVGTETNDHPDLDRSVFSHEVGLLPATAVTVSSARAISYTGGKDTVAPPNCKAYGWGCAWGLWDNYGMPDCWRNHIANVGYDQDGTSGADPLGNAFGGLEIPVSLLAGPGASTTVEITHTYGRTTPLTASCPWDCQATPNGSVDVPDFLALLAQWGQVGTSCDFDGGGVSVTDFLTFLANFGPCP